MRPSPVAQLDHRLWFPDPRNLDPSNAAGLIAVGGDLSVPRLELAYRMGIFPWTIHPLTWWSPSPRAIFELDKFHAPRSLERIIKRQTFEVTLDRAFSEVISACADRPSTWISSEFIAAYTALHQAGRAHSVECWQEGQLAGGVYGVTFGGLFCGESMFHRVTSASKVALWHLVQHVRTRGFALFDIQMVTRATAPLGAIEISRDEYLARLASAVEMRCSFF